MSNSREEIYRYVEDQQLSTAPPAAMSSNNRKEHLEDAFLKDLNLLNILTGLNEFSLMSQVEDRIIHNRDEFYSIIAEQEKVRLLLHFILEPVRSKPQPSRH
jgi:hypothetical protein